MLLTFFRSYWWLSSSNVLYSFVTNYCNSSWCVVSCKPPLISYLTAYTVQTQFPFKAQGCGSRHPTNMVDISYNFFFFKVTAAMSVIMIKLKRKWILSSGVWQSLVDIYTTTVRISNWAEVFIKTCMLKYISITVLFHDKDWESEGEFPWNWIAVADFSSYKFYCSKCWDDDHSFFLYIVNLCIFGWLWNLYNSIITFMTDWHSSTNRNFALTESTIWVYTCVMKSLKRLSQFDIWVCDEYC